MKQEELHTREKVYMLGIGGIGMSALARYFLSAGKKVSGYDRVSTRLTDELAREGADIHFTEDPGYIRQNFPDRDRVLVIYTPAVPPEHAELKYLRTFGYRVVKRAEMLGVISSGEKTVAVAGTHGKTTISCMISHMLRSAGVPLNAFMGGISKNYLTNALLDGEGEWMVMEADEYDRSFLWLYPRIAVVSSCDPDHLDIYGSHENLRQAFCEFIGQVRPGGDLVMRGGLDLGCKIRRDINLHTYSIGGDATYGAENLRNRKGYFRFDARTPGGTIRDIDLGIPGRINLENALAAVCVGQLTGLSEEQIRIALSSFSGVRRRFDVQISRDDLVYIDDYAHHPGELKAIIGSVRENFPGKRITGIFQPHLYSRTRDFVEGFAESLSELDELILLDIYPAREKPIEGVSSKLIFDRVRLKEKILITGSQLLRVVRERKPELLLTLGAGDIDQFVEPLVKLLEPDA